MEQIPELCGFINDEKLEVRSIALQHIASFTDDAEAKKILINQKIGRKLLKIVGDVTSIARNALTALINLAEEDQFLEELANLNEDIIAPLVETITDNKSPLVEMNAMLLSNLTHNEKCCKKLLQVGEDLEGFYACKLADLFCQEGDDNSYDAYSWIGTIFQNMTRIPEGRLFILNKSRKILPVMLRYFQDPNIVRRSGVYAVIKNICFEGSYHSWLLSDEVNLSKILGLALRREDELDEDDMIGMPSYFHNKNVESLRIEKDDEILTSVLESLLLLCRAQQESRNKLRDINLYAILRDYHLQEKNEKRKEVCEEVVELLMLTTEGERYKRKY